MAISSSFLTLCSFWPLYGCCVVLRNMWPLVRYVEEVISMSLCVPSQKMGPLNQGSFYVCFIHPLRMRHLTHHLEQGFLKHFCHVLNPKTIHICICCMHVCSASSPVTLPCLNNSPNKTPPCVPVPIPRLLRHLLS